MTLTAFCAHHSIIPTFPYSKSKKKIKPQKMLLISMTCRISEMYDYSI